jgi:predicted dehydrogenase
VTRSVPRRIGLVGCGRLAELGYVAAFARSAEVDLVAVADPDAERRRGVLEQAKAADLGDVAAHPSAASLLDHTDVDGVVLASPASTHLDDALRATDAGVAVLVEKPPASDVAGAAALAALGPRLWVGFNRRFDPGAAGVRERRPAAGPVRVRAEIHYRRQSWSAHSVVDDALLDLGPHLADWARWTGGDIIEVVAADITPSNAVVDVRLDQGRAQLVASTDSIHREVLELRDIDGRLIARHRLGGLAGAVTGRLATLVARGRGEDSPHPLVASLTAELTAFARAISGDVSPLLGTGDDGLAVMRVIDAARACATLGRPVPVHSSADR